jgi:hypothetical protein
MTVDDIFAELISRTISEILRKLLVTQHDACHASNLRFPKNVYVILTKPEKIFFCITKLVTSERLLK